MRRTAWPPLVLVLVAPLAVADSPLCCRLFGLDLEAILGPDAVTCGKIVGDDESATAQAETVEERKLATRCALEAQKQGRAFVYTYRLLVAPDIDMITQAVFGAGGERMLLKLGIYREENIRTVEICERLTVLRDGKLRGERCHPP